MYRDNILAAWREATAEDLAQGLEWYNIAAELAASLATDSRYTERQCAGVIAALSPMMSWPANVTAARKLIEHHTASALVGHPHHGAPASGFGLGLNVVKAWRILNGADPADVLTSPKVGAFFANIMGDPDAVTVDRWAMRVALGDPNHPGTVRGKRQYADVANAYRDAASTAGVTAREIQAAVWVWIRRTTARAQYSNPTHNLKGT